MSYKAKFILLLVVVLIGFGFFLNWARGRAGRTYDGTAQWPGDRSEFFAAGKCSASPWWLETNSGATYEIRRRWEALGRPAAVRVIFVGDVTSLGRYGSNGKYWREVRPQTVIDVLALTAGCQ
jgi:hypothetical protein